MYFRYILIILNHGIYSLSGGLGIPRRAIANVIFVNAKMRAFDTMKTEAHAWRWRRGTTTRKPLTVRNVKHSI